MLPNLANIAKNPSYPKNCQFFGNTFYCQKFAIFETPAVTINISKIYQIEYKNVRKHSSDVLRYV